MSATTKIRNWMLRSGLLIAALVPATASAQADLFPKGMEEQISTVFNVVIGGLNILAWVMFVILQFLLDPAFIFGEGGQDSMFMLKLNEIWVLSRDLVNIVFAVVLIGAAVYVVVRAKKEIISEYAPKFILSVILVNFSWFIPLLVFDISNVAASAVFGIPSMIMEGNSCKISSTTNLPPEGTCVPGPKPDTFTCGCRAIVNAKFLLNEKDLKEYETEEAKGQGWTCQGGIMCLRYETLDVDTIAGHSAVLNGLIVNHARLQYLNTIPPDAEGDSPQKLFKFLMRLVLILVIHIALFFPLAALALAFAIRIPVLWLTLAFMPFVFLQFVINEKFTGGFPQKIWESFLKAAFLPAIVGIPLSVGFIMVNAGSTSIDLSVITGGSMIEFNINDAIGAVHEFLWLAMTLGVMWVGVFSMLEKMGPMAYGSQAIKGMGQSIGKFAVQAPLSLPVIPSIGNALALPGMVRKFAYDTKNDKEGIFGAWKNIQQGSGGGDAGVPDVATALRNAKDTKGEELIAQGLKDLTAALKTAQTAEERQKAIDTFNKTHVREATGHTYQNLTTDNIVATLRDTDAQSGGKLNSALIDTLETQIKQIAPAAPVPPVQPPPAAPPPVPPAGNP